MAVSSLSLQFSLLSLSLIAFICILTTEAKSDNGLLFKSRDEWTKEEERNYNKCRFERRQKGQSLKEFYLIQHTPNECSDSPRDIMEITEFVLRDHKTKTKVLRFPGCYDIEAAMNIKNGHPLIKTWKQGYIPNLVAYVEWKYNQNSDSDAFKDLDCKNKDHNGCGGAGNKCYYCNFCKGTIEKIQKDEGVAEKDREECPRRAGFSSIKKKNICVDDWGSLDKDNDGEPDFVCYPEFESYRDLLQNIGVEGYGNMYLTFSLSKNDTMHFRRLKKALKGESLENFGKAYRSSLPRIRKERLLGCVNVAFDICAEEPVIGDDGKPHCRQT